MYQWVLHMRCSGNTFILYKKDRSDCNIITIYNLLFTLLYICKKNLVYWFNFWFFVNFTYFQSHSSTWPFISTLDPCKPSKENKKLQLRNKLLPWKLWYVAVCHREYLFAQTASFANVYCNESLVWFEPLAPATLSILDPHWNSSRIYCCCPGDRAALNL